MNKPKKIPDKRKSFGSILKPENNPNANKPSENGLSEKETIEEQLRWLAGHPIINKDKDTSATKKNIQNKAASLRNTKKNYHEKTVDFEIDLHGYAVDEAMVEIETWFIGMRKSGHYQIRVIHGSSDASKVSGAGKQSIQNELYHKLKTQWKTWIVSAYKEVHNSGATIIELKKNP